MEQVARPVLMLELTDSPFLLGAVIAAYMAPSFLLGLFAGVVVDRFPRASVLSASQIPPVAAALVTVLLLATGAMQAWHVLLLSVLSGSNNPSLQPARQAVLPSLVPTGAVRSAVALGPRDALFVLGAVVTLRRL